MFEFVLVQVNIAIHYTAMECGGAGLKITFIFAIFVENCFQLGSVSTVSTPTVFGGRLNPNLQRIFSDNSKLTVNLYNYATDTLPLKIMLNKPSV